MTGGPALPVPPAKLVKRLQDDDFTIVSVDAAGGGELGVF